MRSKVFQRILDNTPKDVDIFVDWYADLVVRINQLLRENNISKKELAEKLDKKPSEISKWLNGEHNFTLRSLAKLSADLGEPLMEVPKKKKTKESNEDFYNSVINGKQIEIDWNTFSLIIDGVSHELKIGNDKQEIKVIDENGDEKIFTR